MALAAPTFFQCLVRNNTRAGLEVLGESPQSSSGSSNPVVVSPPSAQHGTFPLLEQCEFHANGGAQQVTAMLYGKGAHARLIDCTWRAGAAGSNDETASGDQERFKISGPRAWANAPSSTPPSEMQFASMDGESGSGGGRVPVAISPSPPPPMVMVVQDGATIQYN